LLNSNVKNNHSNSKKLETNQEMKPKLTWKPKQFKQAKIKWWFWLLLTIFCFGIWFAHQSIHQMR
tara:strand:+ start:280 stop:474 length:195 start_codon:yes stop_codon:yes gene_type:complete